ncbi:unnamed protein product [Rotaria magnacalcarata]|uniref:C2 domain-containing protein n=1 Tax=Rotaria magnacalcarata TaxID=392030 RepID=A0A8S2LB66_9BILA|nr:unnamed protein product [Rotaria magnacalcarata]
MNNIDTSAILEMEIESPSVEEVSFNLPTHTSNHPISVPIPINTRRINLSRSCGIRENLTDLLITSTSKPRQTLQRTLSTNSKYMLSINRQKRNLPSVPSTTTTTFANQLQLRRANSESRFSLPAVPLPILIPQQTLDDESDLLEIDLNDPVGSIKRNSCSKSNSESNRNNEKSLYPITFSNDNSSKIKQLRDQTTNTPPISSLNSSRKSKKKLKQKTSSPFDTTNDPINYSASPSVRKLQKSTSTEITYPFPITKLILNPSKHGVSTDCGFRITGGHSIAHCMEVTACIEKINIHHRNYEILKNAVHEGDEVLELGGVSLRGKSALFVENLMNTIQNEFEIVVRSRTTNIDADLSLTLDTTLARRHSMSTSQLPLNEPTNNSNNTVTKSKSTSTSISSLHQKSKVMIDNSHQKQNLPPITTLPSNEKSINRLSYRPRPSLLPNDPVSNGVGSNISIDQQNSNESDESDSLSQYFHSSIKQNSTKSSKLNPLGSHGRSQSVIPLASDNINASNRLQSFLSSDYKRSSKDSTNAERKSSLGLSSLQFLKKKTKSVDFSHKKNSLLYQLRENQYAGEIELQIRHDSEREQLVVVIVRAKNLLPKDTNGFSDPFVKVYLLPGRDTVRLSMRFEMLIGSTTKSSFKSLNEFGESQSSSLYDVDNQSARSLWHRKLDPQKLHSCLRYVKAAGYNPICLLCPNMYSGFHSRLRLEKLTLDNLKKFRTKKRDCKDYYLMSIRPENKRRIKYVTRTLNPVWNHTVIYGNMHREELQYKKLEFTVWDYDRFKANDFLGQVTIDLKNPNVIDDKPHWYRLQALRSREEITNRGSSPRLNNLTPGD